MTDRYILANQSFVTETGSGAVISMKHRGDAECEYVLPGTFFGELVLTFQEEEKEMCQWFCSRSEIHEESGSKGSELSTQYSCITEAPSKALRVYCTISLKNDRIEQVYRIRNTAAVPVRILDAAFAMTPNSSFEWGDSAAKKVIGHPFIGGHGSHSLITRCDGTGKYLLITPYSRTDDSLSHKGKWEFFDQAADYPVTEEERKQRSRLYVYEYSEHETKAAVAHGFVPRIEPTSITLEPASETVLGLCYTWAADYEDAREKLTETGIPDIITVPGYTVSRRASVRMCVRGCADIEIKPEFPGNTSCILLSEKNGAKIYGLEFNRLGENYVDVIYGDGQFTRTEFFVTESIRTMIMKRGSFIANHQFRDPEKWYDGLLAEWNNRTGVMPGPDNYDCIRGWRIYEVTCDDPGLSKPAFLSGKAAEFPVQEEVDALDYYIEHFVWGGLQCTEEEPYPYGIYGIPDWHANRNSDDPGCKGREHLWRIYDYPHIALMYYNMYRIASDYADIYTELPAREYLKRACNTAITMFTLPLELEEWSAYETGLYNENVIVDIIAALEAEGMQSEAAHLKRHWDRKTAYFISKCKDLFGSEYPFDTTGFESTHALARTGLEQTALRKNGNSPSNEISYSDAVSFLENQINCNIACRGFLEPAYFWYGSDYRANNHHYTLSYMSQMGGWSILDYALYFAKDPYPLLRLGYGSFLSSWALLNSGDSDSNYGYFFPGKQNDGAACGGFEPLPYGETWLEQPHSSGAWYYSCEIDLGFCGALRAAACILADDPLFGTVLYGGRLQENEDGSLITPEDGVSRRFHIVRPEGRLHVTLNKGHFSDKIPIRINRNCSEVTAVIDTDGLYNGSCIDIKVDCDDASAYVFECGGAEYEKSCSLPITGGTVELHIRRIR